MSKSFDEIFAGKNLGLRNRKNPSSLTRLSEIFNDFQEQANCESKTSQEYAPLQFTSSKGTQVTSIQDMSSYNEPPAGATVFKAYPKTRIDQMKDSMLEVISQGGKSLKDVISSTFGTLEKSTQELLSTFSKQEKEFINGIASQAAKHHVTQAVISALSISPQTAAILTVAMMMGKLSGATAQPVPGTDFAIFDGFPPDAQNLCSDQSLPSNNVQCKQFYVTYNQNTVVQSVSTLLKEGDWDKGRIPVKELCVDSFSQCRDIDAMKSAMSKMLQDPNVTRFINAATPCTDTPISLDSRCSSNTVFKGLSGVGCSQMLGWDRNNSISKFNQCLSSVRQNLTDTYATCKPGDESFQCWSTGKQAGLVLGISGGLAALCMLVCACGTETAAQWRKEQCEKICPKR